MIKQMMAVIVMLWRLSAGSQPATTFVVSRPEHIETKDTSFLKFKTIEEALGLPRAYTVKYYTVLFNIRGEIYLSAYAWYPEKIAWWAQNARKGDKLTIDEIVVVRDGVEKKMMPKTFTF